MQEAVECFKVRFSRGLAALNQQTLSNIGLVKMNKNVFQTCFSCKILNGKVNGGTTWENLGKPFQF